MTRDRIEKVQELIARFPERSEYQINSSASIAAKDRVSTVGRLRRVTAEKEERRRPTLKRRKPANDQQAEEPEKKEKPTLKRRPADS
jgi:hypothetical protein